MAKKQKPTAPAPSPKAPPESKKQTVSTSPNANLLARLDGWLNGKTVWLATAVFIASIIIRTVLFQQAKDTPLQSMHTWGNSDMEFFDYWAKDIAAGDWLTDTVLHPYHEWHDSYSKEYFRAYPDAAATFLAHHQNADGTADTLAARKEMVQEIYQGKVLHQEPLYVWLLAIVYKIFGTNPYWMYLFQMLLGSITNVFVFLVGRRYFGPLAGLLAAILVMTSGPILVYEITVLRTTLTGFFSLLVLHFFQKMVDENTRRSQLVFGAVAGLSLLNQSYFLLFLLPAIGWYASINRANWRLNLTGLGWLFAALFLIMSPLFIRNLKVGAPLTSMASNGAITYILFNSSNAAPLEPSYMHFASTAKLMHESGGKLVAAAGACLRSFDDFGGILKLYRQKIGGLFMWYEVPNNMSYYIYKEFSGLLMALPAAYWLIAPLGICGLIFGFWRLRWRFFPIFLMVAASASPLFISASLARYRPPFVMLMSLLAAFIVIDFLRNLLSLKWKEGVAAAAIFSLAFYYTDGIRDSRYFTLFQNDIMPVYNLHYKDRLVELEKAQNTTEYLKLTTELVGYIPDYFHKVKANHQAFGSNEANTCRYVATLFTMHSTILKFNGKEAEGQRFADRVKVLNGIADEFNRRIGK